MYWVTNFIGSDSNYNPHEYSSCDGSSAMDWAHPGRTGGQAASQLVQLVGYTDRPQIPTIQAVGCPYPIC